MNRYLIGMLLLGLLASGCAASKSEVDTLSARVWDQDQQQRRLQGQLAALDQELTKLLTEMEGMSTPMRATQANLWAEIEGLRMQTATMQGQIEELQRLIQDDRPGDGQAAELSRQVDYLDRSVNMIAGQLALDLGPRPEGEPSRPGGTPSIMPGDMPRDMPRDMPGTPPGDRPDETQAPDQRFQPIPEEPAADRVRLTADDPAQVLYDRALMAFHDREYDQARRMWDEFARTFTDHALVSNALFWQGESFFQMEDYAQAVLAYQDVISKHPQSNKYAAAMLKQGVSFFRLGKDRAGVLVLEDLIKRFPNQPEATRAKTLLEEQRN